ncbi:fluoride efflux transporter FluC [Streptomyces sclerotialus]|uniref:fluoride efflux transporter FluC n=1 Tax=Streptomyces sclerotialus TaxID=1957 RepID=UPI00099BD446
MLNEPVDPDVDLHVPPRPPAARRERQGPVVAAVALGGALGAVARYGSSLLWPTAPGAFPWTTMAVNTAGCALIGVLMAVLGAARTAHTLTRPFLGTGVLGGFTTFSTYAVDIQRLVEDGKAATGLAYLALTLLAALAAVWAAATGTRRVLCRRRRVLEERRRALEERRRAPEECGEGGRTR